MLVRLSASSKLRHDEMMHKVKALEKKVTHLEHKLTTGSFNPNSSTGNRLSSEEEHFEDPQFCVPLPVQTFKDFDQLDKEIGENKLKRKFLKKMVMDVGSCDTNDLITTSISSLIQRPQLAQYFNCGGHPKAGSVIKQAGDKHNFMGTNVQKNLFHVVQKEYGKEDLRSFQSKVSDILKRSSTMKGGEHYKKKKLMSTRQSKKS